MTSPRPVSLPTLCGFLVAAFGVSATLLLLKPLAPPGQLTDAYVIMRELALFAVTGLLLLIVVLGEKRGLDSLGLHGRHWGRAAVSSLLIYLVCMAVAIACSGLSQALGFKEGVPFAGYRNVSAWTMTLIMVRAGVVEEICYRGYLMERLEQFNRHWSISLLLPAAFFGLLHYAQGPRGILIAFGVGLVLGLAYRRTCDLKANILAHFLIDFIANVLPRLLH